MLSADSCVFSIFLILFHSLASLAFCLCIFPIIVSTFLPLSRLPTPGNAANEGSFAPTRSNSQPHPFIFLLYRVSTDGSFSSFFSPWFEFGPFLMFVPIHLIGIYANCLVGSSTRFRGIFHKSSAGPPMFSPQDPLLTFSLPSLHALLLMFLYYPTKFQWVGACLLFFFLGLSVGEERTPSLLVREMDCYLCYHPLYLLELFFPPLFFFN